MRIGIDARLYGVASGTGIGRYTEELIRAAAELTSERSDDAGRTSVSERVALDGGPPIARRRLEHERGWPATGPASAPLGQRQAPRVLLWASDRPRECRDCSERQFVVFLRKEAYDAFTLPNDQWTKVVADFRPYTAAVQTRYPEIIRAAGVDAMHFTHFDHPMRCPVPFATTIHDLILLHHHSMRGTMLGPIRFAAKYIGYRAVLAHAIRRSTRIFTPSQAVADEMIERFRIPPDRCILTPLGIDHHQTNASSQPSTIHHQPSTPYAIYVGNAYPHKQLEWLVRAWPEATRAHPGLRLVLVNREDPFTQRIRAECTDRTRIVFVPALPATELRALIAGASAYVSASACEGFDLPTVEALAAGIPVIASDIPVHREILGDAAMFFTRGDTRALASAIHRVLVDNAHRGILIANGYARARAYTWRTCAYRTLDGYHALAHAIPNSIRSNAEPPHASISIGE